MVSLRVFVSDAFDRDFFREYFESYSQELNISRYLKERYVYIKLVGNIRDLNYH